MDGKDRYIMDLVTFNKQVTEIIQAEVDAVMRGRPAGIEKIREQINYRMDDRFFREK